MQRQADGRKFLNAICDALGLSMKVRRVCIDIELDRPPVVMVEEVMSTGDATAVEVVMKDFEVVEIVHTTSETELDDDGKPFTVGEPGDPLLEDYRKA